MLDLQEKQTTELPLDTAAKRALIETELRTNPNRSDREIARVVGCDHKTVGTRRREMGIAEPLGNSPEPPTPTERRHMLIEGCKDFDAKYPPGPSEVGTAEEAVDNAIASGKIGLGDRVAASKRPVSTIADEDGREAQAGRDIAAAQHPAVLGAVDQCRGAMLRIKEERKAEAEKQNEANDERTVLRAQREITIQHDDESGEWVIKQKQWPDDDGVVCINDEHIHAFIDELTTLLGYGRAQ